MGTIYPTGYPIGGKCTECEVNGIWELYIQLDIQLGGNVQNVKLMEYGNYISNRISNWGKCTECKVNGIWELYIQLNI